MGHKIKILWSANTLKALQRNADEWIDEVGPLRIHSVAMYDKSLAVVYEEESGAFGASYSAAPKAVENPGPAPGCDCGVSMILRYRRKDGKPFWGCSEYPQCRTVKPYKDEEDKENEGQKKTTQDWGGDDIPF